MGLPKEPLLVPPSLVTALNAGEVRPGSLAERALRRACDERRSVYRLSTQC